MMTNPKAATAAVRLHGLVPPPGCVIVFEPWQKQLGERLTGTVQYRDIQHQQLIVLQENTWNHTFRVDPDRIVEVLKIPLHAEDIEKWKPW